MTYSLVIFDLDGTLIDSSEGIIRAVSETIRELKLEYLSPEFIRSCIGPPIGDSIGSKIGYSPEQIDAFYKVFRPIYKEKYLMDCTIYPGVVELLKKLRASGIKTAIATNKRKDYTKTLLDNLKLTLLFDAIEAVDMEGKLTKTDLVGNCMRRLSCPGEGTIMVGDARSDYDAASAWGIDFIGVKYGFGFCDDCLTEFNIVDSVSDLEKVIL